MFCDRLFTVCYDVRPICSISIQCREVQLQLDSLTIIRWIVCYPVDIALSNVWTTRAGLKPGFFYAEVRSNEETDQMKLKGQVSREGGALVVWDWIAQQVCSWAAHFEPVSVRQLGGPGACSPGKLLNLSPLKSLEMHLKLWWCGENFQRQKPSP